MPKKLTHQEFLKKLEERNNSLPPVFLVSGQFYQKNNIKLLFKCINGHEWFSTPDLIINQKRGCPECKKLNENLNKRIPWENIFQQMKQKAPNIDFVETTYKNATSKMKAICKKHGEFTLTPIIFLRKPFCPHCKKLQDRKTKHLLFVEKARKKHNNFYSYSQVTFNDSNTKVKIVCPVHGEFFQNPNDHLRGHGCPKCIKSSISKKQIFWLEHIAKIENKFIQHAGNIGEYLIPGTKYRVDGFNETTKTIYEFHGDAFHGNLKVYQPNEKCHPFNKNVTALELYKKTIEKHRILQNMGYNVVYIWESDFNQLFPEFCYSQVKLVNEKNFFQHEIPTTTFNLLKIRLADNQIFRGYKIKHNYVCMLCNNEFQTTLTQRLQAYKKHQSVGCPKCNQAKRRKI